MTVNQKTSKTKNVYSISQYEIIFPTVNPVVRKSNIPVKNTVFTDGVYLLTLIFTTYVYWGLSYILLYLTKKNSLVNLM